MIRITHVGSVNVSLVSANSKTKQFSGTHKLLEENIKIVSGGMDMLKKERK